MYEAVKKMARRGNNDNLIELPSDDVLSPWTGFDPLSCSVHIDNVKNLYN